MRLMRVGRLISLLVMLGLISPAAIAVQRTGGGKSQRATSDKKKRAPRGTPVLWSEPSDIASRDLMLGPGGEEMKPDLSRVTFVKEETGGYSKKYRVRDGKGREWVAKIGKEAQSETAATRLVWAVGYPVEVTYLAPRVEIEGKGSFENVRFEARPENVKRLDKWTWEKNPFSGTRELQGLKIMMALIENWDTKDDNNRILHYKASDGGRDELRYVISDLGASFGKADGSSGPISWLRQVKGSRNEPEDYAGDEFVKAVEGEYVRLEFGGKNSDMMRNITVADARWMGELLSRLSDEQIRDAFRAANYPPEEVELLAGEVRRRIEQLANIETVGASSR